MTSKTTAGFWECFNRLPADVQKLARARYLLWQRDPFHPSLHFKPDRAGPVVGANQRAVSGTARRRADIVAWFGIGTHNDYNHLISRS